MAQRRSSWPGGSTCRCSRWTPRELADPRYLENPTDRCYFCKTELWLRLGRLPRARGFDTIIDGTNADDLGEHRPGLRAAEEHRVRSPLAELGMEQGRGTRRVARAGVAHVGRARRPVPLQPGPCTGSRSRRQRLRQVEEGEAYLRSLGVAGDLRVRHHGDRARIEVAPDQFPGCGRTGTRSSAHFSGLGFAEVELDPAGYRRGGLLALRASPR